MTRVWMLHRLSCKEWWCSVRPWQRSNLPYGKSFLHLLPESHYSSSVVFWGFAVDAFPPPSACSPSSGRHILRFLCCSHTTEAELMRWLHRGSQPQEQVMTVKGWSYPISHTRGMAHLFQCIWGSSGYQVSFSFPPSEYLHQSLSSKNKQTNKLFNSYKLSLHHCPKTQRAP